ncbi:STAS domain-containing protein [Alkalinema sp. FACHB-956]|uniref:STAS domain-containing protein n=1 Tax=Alkalinema sp. FACHB-956 TaxID=2692768 RepID=UPI0016839058|nr:STAS domain-containing protein [Alkalinema sp. FACHB-956]MBD2328992.1 STAS domain-containing protein [Alkalinema sp. FACHB-956]
MQSVLTRPQGAVIRPQGSVIAATASELHSQLTQAVLSNHCDALVVDMSQVESLDSAGLMALVSTLHLAQKENKRFTLCALPAPIRIIFELSQLDRAFEILDHPSTFEAMAA